MTSKPHRKNLAEALRPRIIEAVLPTLRTGATSDEIGAAIYEFLKTPEIQLLLKRYSREERYQLHDEVLAIIKELGDLAPQELLAPKQHVVQAGDYQPAEVTAMLDTAAARVSQSADDALRQSADDPPSQRELSEWIASCPPEVLTGVETRLAELWDLDPKRVKVTGWTADFGGLILLLDGVLLHVPAAEVVSAAIKATCRSRRFDTPDAVNPLAVLIKAWKDARVTRIAPSRHPFPIIPSRFAKPQQPQLFSFPSPSLPGPTTGEPTAGYLPGLEPDAPPEPALILAMFDAGGGSSLSRNGRVSNAASIWLEALLDMPTAARDGMLHETTYELREVAGDWLGWDLRFYRRTGKTTGQALASALKTVRDIWVPMNDRGGGYFPVMVSAVSGWGLDDQVAFAKRLPRGNVGPRVNRALLRRLRSAGPAYRAYLSLVFEWDKYGSRNGKLIRPTRPEVRRAPGGQVVNGRGEIVLGRGGLPVLSPHDRRAIRTGEREPNPDRTRYPEYGIDDVVRLAYPARVYKDKAQRRQARHHVRKILMHLEAEGVVVETLGPVQHQRYRIMPSENV